MVKSKPYLSLEDARAIAAAVESEAAKHHWAVSTAVVDDGSHLLWLQRLDGAAPISAQIAHAKARTAALGRRESRIYEELINGPRAAFLSAPGLEGMLEGGVPVMVLGQCAGAVGVSGVKSSDDVQIAPGHRGAGTLRAAGHVVATFKSRPPLYSKGLPVPITPVRPNPEHRESYERP